MNDTIIAQSSPAGRGAICVLRMSGSRAAELLEGSFFTEQPLLHAVMRLGRLDAGGISDKVMACVFFPPYSYTGEIVAEIYCHGSQAIADRVLRHFTSLGARIAEGGEFTKRAFLSGRISLDEAEAVCDLINAESDTQINAAFAAVSGKLSGAISEIAEGITEVLAGIEAAIDYPEEDIETESSEAAADILKACEKRLAALISTFDDGSRIRSGVRVAIIGAANAGKSSLLNALLGYDRAIVTAMAGTTRDTIEESYVYRGILYTLTDTAGLRQAADEAEVEGVRRSREAAKNAHLVIWLGDESGFCKKPDAAKILKVRNKIDLGGETDGEPAISALSGEGLGELKERIFELTRAEISGEEMLTNARHFAAAENSLAQIRSALGDLRCPPDCFAVYLKNALASLGEITGATASEDVIDKIFSKFCVGK